MKRIVVALLILCIQSMFAQERDTLDGFTKGGRNTYYRIPGVAAVAARFTIGKPASLLKIELTVTGRAGASAVVHVYGGEYSATAPLYAQDQTEAVTLIKRRDGQEVCEVAFAKPLPLHSRQFFVAVDNISGDFCLVTDDAGGGTDCDMRRQALRMADGTWWSAANGFAIRAVVEYHASAAWLVDHTEEAGLATNACVALSVACGDFDRNSATDILAGRQLLLNRSDGTFVTHQLLAGDSLLEAASFFMDADGDETAEILLLARRVFGAPMEVYLVRSDSDGNFRHERLEWGTIVNPTSVSLADFDKDGNLDVFIGQSSSGDSVPPRCLLMRNLERGQFADVSSSLFADVKRYRSRGSQWVDVDGNGFPDLFASCDSSALLVYANRGDGTFRQIGAVESFGAVAGRGSSVGGHWAPVRAGADREIVFSLNTHASRYAGRVHPPSVVLAKQRDGVDLLVARMEIAGQEMQGPASWVDLNNDGVLDVFLAGDGNCGAAELYLGHRGGTYECVTAQSGLLGERIGPAAVWADLDSDGKVDLVSLRDGQPRVWLNRLQEERNRLNVILPNYRAVGGSVVLYVKTGSIATEVTSGHGVLSQEPLDLHIGLDSNVMVDSLVYTDPRGIRQVFGNVEVNRVLAIPDQHQTKRVKPFGFIGRVEAYPNPSSAMVTIRFELLQRADVLIRVGDLQGGNSWVICRAPLETGIQSYDWTPALTEDVRASGEYYYEINAGGDRYVGKIVIEK